MRWLLLLLLLMLLLMLLSLLLPLLLMLCLVTFLFWPSKLLPKPPRVFRDKQRINTVGESSSVWSTCVDATDFFVIVSLCVAAESHVYDTK